MKRIPKGVGILAPAVFAVWALGWLVWTALHLSPWGATVHGVYVPAGYRANLDLFLQHNWLEFEPRTRSLTLSQAARQQEAIERFYENSFLRQDVEAFNNGDISIFRIENGRPVDFDAARHNVLLPFSTLRSWQGDLTYRPLAAVQAELRGAGTAIRLTRPEGHLDDPEQYRTVQLRPQDRDAHRVVVDDAVNLSAPGDFYFGKIHLIGPHLVFNNRQLSPSAVTSVSGAALPTGNRARIDTGDVLKLSWREGRGPLRYALLQAEIASDAPVISVHRSINGADRRAPDAAEIEPPFAADVVAALNNAMQQLDEDGRYRVDVGREVEEFDLALTLDSRLHAAVQQALNQYVASLAKATDDQTDAFRAAVCVMDAKSGEILALASYPTRDELRGWIEGTQVRDRMLRNQNFARLPVGSVAKVMFAAAIADQAPFLADLQIRDYGERQIEEEAGRMLGLELIPPLEDHPVYGGDGWVDFEEFIQYSSNRYAATLLTLAAGVDKSGTDFLPDLADPAVESRLDFRSQFRIGNREYTERPRLLFKLEPPTEQAPGVTARVGASPTLETLPFVRRLAELFDVDTLVSSPRGAEGKPERRRGNGEGDDSTDTELWLPVLKHLYGSEEEIPPLKHPFFGVSPERASLAFNLIGDYRREYITLILGGAASSWSSVQVCSAFSRIVTGAKVKPQIVKRIRAGETAPARPEPDFGELGLNDTIRRRLMTGMARVARSGTADSLSGVVRQLDERLARQGLKLGFYSKTGSPRTISFEPSRVGEALSELIARGALRLGPDGRIQYRDFGYLEDDEGDGIESGARARSIEAVQAGDGDVLQRFRLSAASIVRMVGYWNDSRPEDRIPFFSVFQSSGGQRQWLEADSYRMTDSTSASFAFTMAAYPADSGDWPLPEPERALTIYVFIEGQGNGPKIAVPFAQQLIEEHLGNALAEGW